MNETSHEYFYCRLPDVMTWGPQLAAAVPFMTLVVWPTSSANVANQPIRRAYDQVIGLHSTTVPALDTSSSSLLSSILMLLHQKPLDQQPGINI